METQKTVGHGNFLIPERDAPGTKVLLTDISTGFTQQLRDECQRNSVDGEPAQGRTLAMASVLTSAILVFTELRVIVAVHRERTQCLVTTEIVSLDRTGLKLQFVWFQAQGWKFSLEENQILTLLMCSCTYHD